MLHGNGLDLTGERIGRVTVVGRAPDDPSRPRAGWLWQCACDCGGAVVHPGRYLRQRQRKGADMGCPSCCPKRGARQQPSAPRGITPTGLQLLIAIAAHHEVDGSSPTPEHCAQVCGLSRSHCAREISRLRDERLILRSELRLTLKALRWLEAGRLAA